MYRIFYNCSQLRSIDVSGWNTAKVDDFSYMFYNCSGLTSLDVTGFNTGSASDIGHMFYGCSNLTSLDVSGFNTESVGGIGYTFYNCAKLTEIDISSWDLSKVGGTNVPESTFEKCNSLKSLTIPATLHYIGNKFAHSCTSLESITFLYDGGQGDILLLPTAGAVFGAFYTDSYKETELNFNGRPAAINYSWASDNRRLETIPYVPFQNGTLTYNGRSQSPTWIGYNSNKMTISGTTKATEVGNYTAIFTPKGCYTWSDGTTDSRRVSWSIYSDTPTMATGARWFYQGSPNNGGTAVSAAQVTSIEFTKDPYNTDGKNIIDQWDASIESYGINDDSGIVTAYLEYDGTEDNYKVTIAGDGSDKILANANSSYMFGSSGSQEFTNLKEIRGIDLLDTKNVTNMDYMFYNCRGLTNLDLSSFNTSLVTSMTGMFRGCSNLKYLDVSGFNTARVTSMSYMFRDCSNLLELDLSNFNTENVEFITSMFEDCTKLTDLDVSNFNNKKVASFMYMFKDCSSLVNLNLCNFTTSNAWSMFSMFDGCSSLEYLDLSNFDTTKLTDANYIFADCSSLKELDLTSFNTSNLESLMAWFYNCSGLTSVDLSSFDTSKVSSMYQTFYNCSSLTSLDLSNFNTENVLGMEAAFQNCKSLKTLDISSFNTQSVKNMLFMFYNCNALEYVDLSGFNTQNVTNMGSMFSSCKALTELDLSNFQTQSVTNMRYMLSECNNLSTVYVSNSWVTDAVTDSTNMFNKCASLVGGNGTAYDSTKVDATYAHIDGGTENPGYFTYKDKQ